MTIAPASAPVALPTSGTLGGIIVPEPSGRPRRKCTFEGCVDPYLAKGYCRKHYKRWKAHGDPSIVREPTRPQPTRCIIGDCATRARSLGMCAKHHRRFLRTGTTETAPPGRTRPGRGSLVRSPWCSVKGCGRPHDSKGYCQGHYLRWRATGDPGAAKLHTRLPREIGTRRLCPRSGYVWVRVGHGKRGWRHEHRVVMEAIKERALLPGENVHHKNRIKHDNRPENLELWNHSQPAGARVEDVIEHALAMLRLYAPERLAT